MLHKLHPVQLASAASSRGQRAGRTRPWVPVLATVLCVATAGCQEREEESCELPEEIADCYEYKKDGSVELEEEHYAVDATVIAVGFESNRWTGAFETETGESVELTLNIPENRSPPVEPGQPVIFEIDRNFEGVSQFIGWWETWIEVMDSNGATLVFVSDTSHVTDEPSICPPVDSTCGTRIFPPMRLSDGQLLYAGESTTTVREGELFWVQLCELWVYHEISCTDQPKGWRKSIWVRVPAK